MALSYAYIYKRIYGIMASNLRWGILHKTTLIWELKNDKNEKIAK